MKEVQLDFIALIIMVMLSITLLVQELKTKAARRQKISQLA